MTDTTLPFCGALKCNKILESKDIGKWLWMTFSQLWCGYITVSAHLVAKHWQHSLMRFPLILVRWPPLHSATNQSHCRMSDTTTRIWYRSRLLFREDQSLTSVATTVNLFVACLLNYSFEMCILVLTDHSGNSTTLKYSLSWRGVEVKFRFHFKIRSEHLHFMFHSFILNWIFVQNKFSLWNLVELLNPIYFPLTDGGLPHNQAY